MKIATVVVFLLFAFTIKSYFFRVATAANNPVLDIDGEELRAGVDYYVVSAIRGAGGGGLALGRTKDQKCPEVVVQRRFDLDYGNPVQFSNSDTNDDVIHLSTDINIKFVGQRDRLCLTSTVWKLDNYDPSAGKWWLTTDGVIGNPGPNTLTSWFKIEKAGVMSYKFTYCPSVCASCTTLCGDIERYGDNEQIRLALGDNGWPFVFIKKTSTSTIKQVVNAKH
ncbi:hypothetical protein DITRI_Ditri15bG0023900 [Diplodiscus trichospermus]